MHQRFVVVLYFEIYFHNCTLGLFFFFAPSISLCGLYLGQITNASYTYLINSHANRKIYIIFCKVDGGVYKEMENQHRGTVMKTALPFENRV
jgi:hypothetical protein